VLIQVQYKIPASLQFSRSDLNRWRKEFIAGKKPSNGVTVSAVDWDGGEPKDWLSRNEYVSGHAGVVARYAQQNQTFCDYDTVRHVGTIENIFRVARCLGIKPQWIEYRRTNRGWHVVVQWNRKFKPSETVMLQAILGSDPIREMFNATRVLSGKANDSKRWNLLFERKVSD
jgi:hypothetical protein